MMSSVLIPLTHSVSSRNKRLKARKLRLERSQYSIPSLTEETLPASSSNSRAQDTKSNIKLIAAMMILKKELVLGLVIFIQSIKFFRVCQHV